MPQPELLATFEAYFSPTRISIYLDEAKGDRDLALKLYDWNIRISSAMFEDLATIEILLRNALDRVLVRRYGDEWFKAPGLLKQNERTLIDEAIDAAKRRWGEYDYSIDSVVAQLSFGFWRALLAANYTSLWNETLGDAFPHTANPKSIIRRGDIEERIENLGDLRNAIAHHDPVFDWDFQRSFRNAKMIAGAISPQIQSWMVSRSRVQGVLGEDPRVRSRS